MLPKSRIISVLLLGLGVALIDAVNYRDVQVVQAVSLLIAAVYVVVNLLADLVSIAANPKLRSN